MEKRILLKTNLLACAVILSGFLITTFFSSREYYSSSVRYIEEVSDLTNEGIYYQIETMLAKPLHVSQTIAQDSLFKELILQEGEHMDDPAYIKKIAEYLKAYRDKYQYDAVSLTSNATNRYYNFNGLDRSLSRSAPEDSWYYNLLESPKEYLLDIGEDNSTGASNAVTLFVDCKISDGEKILGAVGVGMRIDSMQNMLKEYSEQFGVNAYFINYAGTIELSTEHSGYENTNFFGKYDEATQEAIMNWHQGDRALTLWRSDDDNKTQTHIVVRDLADIGWRLVATRDMNNAMSALWWQIALDIFTLAVVVILVLVIITWVISSFKRQLISMEHEHELERQNMFEKVTNQLFEEIYAIDVTNNRLADKATENYFEQLGVPKGTPLDECLRIMAEKLIKPEFRQGYLDTFSREHIFETFAQGENVIKYEFMMTNDGENYYWMRITAQLVLSEIDGALHMLSFRQNIDEEKKRELAMKERAQLDEMTGLLHKVATQHAIDARLQAEPDVLHALFIFDIDHFKQANDRFGHAFGDDVIQKFAMTIRHHFRKGDLVGRIGGDEFVAFLTIPNVTWVCNKAEQLRQALDQYCVERNEISHRWHMTASIGAALSPRDGSSFQELYRSADTALYQAKQKRNSFMMHVSPEQNSQGE